MEFADFDDDLFEEKPTRGSVADGYQARMCEAGWFMKVRPDQLVSQEDELGVVKFAADYLYLNKSYDAAAVKYEEILNGLPESSTSSRRECQENLARCHIKAGTPNVALLYAEKIHSSSKTLEQLSVSYSVLLDVYLAAGKHDDALMAAQNLISLHPDNGHLWMKLGFVYACMKMITLPNVGRLIKAHLPASVKTSSTPTSEPTRLEGNAPDCLQNSPRMKEVRLAQKVGEQENTRRDIIIIASCLHRAYYILVKTEGTAVGFGVSYTKTCKEKLLGDLKFLLDDFSLKELRQNIHQNDKMEISLCSSEFSESNCKDNTKCRSDDGDREKYVSLEEFEEKWFKWVL